MRNAAIDTEACESSQRRACAETQFGREPRPRPLTMGLILELTRNIGRGETRRHAWPAKPLAEIRRH